MRALLTAILMLGTLIAGGPAEAGSLYDDLGGQQGIQGFVGRTIDLSYQDERIKETFAKSKPDYLKKMITEQIAALAGGPVKYTGLDMKKAHKGLGLNTFHFNALVELLQQAMAEQGIGYQTQNRLLALLAPMHRDVVEVRSPWSDARPELQGGRSQGEGQPPAAASP
ncbi:MAG: group 1 truncated hemoglobin [Sphingomonadales bacterium]